MFFFLSKGWFYHCLNVKFDIFVYLLTGRFWTVGMDWRDGRLVKLHPKLDSFITTTSKWQGLLSHVSMFCTIINLTKDRVVIR